MEPVGGIEVGCTQIGANNSYQAGYQWNDANGDGLPQQPEATFYGGGIPNSWEPHTAADFICFMATGDNKERWVSRFAVTSWNDAGSPIYGTMRQGERFATMPQRFDPPA